MVLLFWVFIVLMTLVALAILLSPFRKREGRMPGIAVTLMIIMLPLLAMTLYGYLGSFQSLEEYWTLKQEARQVRQELSKIKGPQKVINQLKGYLALHPDSPKGWYLLGKLYFGEKDYSGAILALQKARDQRPSNAQYTVAFAQASFLQNHRHLSPTVLKMLKRILQKEPHNVSATNLLAIHYYLQKEYQTAVQYWESLLPLFPAESSDQKVLLSMIANAQKKINKKRRK